MLKKMDEKLLSPMEFIEYAKDNGYNSTMFEILSQDGKHICFGKCIDIYFEFVEIPIIGEGFVALREVFGEIGYDVHFLVITDEDFFKNGIACDFVIRGKTIPEKYK